MYFHNNVPYLHEQCNLLDKWIQTEPWKINLDQFVMKGFQFLGWI